MELISNENNKVGKDIFPADYENGLLSIEVAEMMEKKHYNLLRDIKKYTEQMFNANQGFSQLKIESADFWTETTYTDEQGKSRPCYLITKAGCEFLAHKLTGEKGTAFTARYIICFHRMERKLEQEKLFYIEPPEDITKVRPKSPNRLLAILPPKHMRWAERNRNKIKTLKAAAFLRQDDFWSDLERKIDEEFGITYVLGRMARETGCMRVNVRMLPDYYPEIEKFADEYLARYFESKAISDYYKKHYEYLDN